MSKSRVDNCKLCELIHGYDGEIALITCRRCRLPLAIWCEHEPTDTLNAHEGLEKFLYAEAERREWRGKVEHFSGTGHLRAHFRPIATPYKTIPQELADEMAFEAQRCVVWFHKPDDVYLGDMSVREIEDEEVRLRILGMQYAMDKEVARYSGGGAGLGPFTQLINPITYEGYDTWVEKWEEFRESPAFTPLLITSQVTPGEWRDGTAYDGNPLRYDLRLMPFERQRALVQNWERIWNDYVAAHNLSWDELGFKTPVHTPVDDAESD